MAHDAQGAPSGPAKLVIRNIGLVLSGAMENPILDADTIVAVDGRITAIGKAGGVDTEGATTIVDAMGIKPKGHDFNEQMQDPKVVRFMSMTGG